MACYKFTQENFAYPDQPHEHNISGWNQKDDGSYHIS